MNASTDGGQSCSGIAAPDDDSSSDENAGLSGKCNLNQALDPPSKDGEVGWVWSFFLQDVQKCLPGICGENSLTSREQDGSSKQTAMSRMPESPDTDFTSFSCHHNQQIHTSEKLNFSLTKILSIGKQHITQHSII